MFSGIGFSEILIVLLVALLVMGPEKFPDAARKIGKGMREMRRMSSNLREMLMLDEDLNPLEQGTRAESAGPRPAAQPAAALGASVARGERRAAPMRPVLLNNARRATHVRVVALPPAAPVPPAAHDAESTVSGVCTLHALPAARRMIP